MSDPHTPLRIVLLTVIQVAVLMNNAGIGPKGGSWEGLESWEKVFSVNVFGSVSWFCI
jgi:NAD(P)-dependent dehydrogenase (short-subunit alcohol dehydrogenase family)